MENISHFFTFVIPSAFSPLNILFQTGLKKHLKAAFKTRPAQKSFSVILTKPSHRHHSDDALAKSTSASSLQNIFPSRQTVQIKDTTARPQVLFVKTQRMNFGALKQQADWSLLTGLQIEEPTQIQ